MTTPRQFADGLNKLHKMGRKSCVPEIPYYYRGQIERGPRYEWRDGYSSNSPEGFVRYPWMTKRECQRDAKARGGKAVFFRSP